jgi:hypothetical protein
MSQIVFAGETGCGQRLQSSKPIYQVKDKIHKVLQNKFKLLNFLKAAIASKAHQLSKERNKFERLLINGKPLVKTVADIQYFMLFRAMKTLN